MLKAFADLACPQKQTLYLCSASLKALQGRSLSKGLVCQQSVLEAPSTSAEGVETIQATLRNRGGRLASKQDRKLGRVPAILYSLPGEVSQLLTLDKRATDRLITAYGRSGLTSRLFDLEVAGEDGGLGTTYRVLPRMVHQTATTLQIENVTFMHCPPERIVDVDVPIQIMGEDVSPGVKKGGFVLRIRRSLACRCLGDSIPPAIEVDVSGLEIGDKVGLEELELPPGALLNVKSAVDPVCKIAGRAGRD